MSPQTSGVFDPSDDRAKSAAALSAPGPLADVLSIPGIDAARFWAVIEAFGPLPFEGRGELASRLISARGQYLAHRMSVCDDASTEGDRRKRLKQIGSAAARLQKLLHRDEAEPEPWNFHPGITLALPRLCQIASEQHRPVEIWDPPQGLSLLTAMLSDLAEVGLQAGFIFHSQFPQDHGGRRREGLTPAAGLVERLVEIYGAMRTQYPESGSVPAYDASLRQFVRAGLGFVVSQPQVTGSDGIRYQLFEASFLETDLPSRIT
jgi:hypothetical protein